MISAIHASFCLWVCRRGARVRSSFNVALAVTSEVMRVYVEPCAFSTSNDLSPTSFPAIQKRVTPHTSDHIRRPTGAKQLFQSQVHKPPDPSLPLQSKPPIDPLTPCPPATLNRLSTMMSATTRFVGVRARASCFTSVSPRFSVGIRLFSTQDTSDTGLYDKVAFVGAGKMAQSMISPLIKTGIQPASKISVFDVSTSTLSKLKKQYNDIETAKTLTELVEDADLVVCCVKPQNLTPNFFQQVAINKDATLLTVIAGKPIQTYLDGGFTKVARSMPNTPAQIGRGMTVWSCTENISTDEREKIKTILSSFGKSIFVDDEDFIDMSTSISGSGPAYIFLLMESMIDAGVHMGFSRETATTLVHHTILGSTLYAMETGEHPAVLRNSVTSPAGTTASALYELENGRFRTVIKDAIWACYRRSLEMGGNDSNVGPGRNTAEIPVVHHYVGAPRGEMVDEDSDGDSDSEDEQGKAIQSAAKASNQHNAA